MDTILLTLSIVSGQLVRLPFAGGGINLLDISIMFLCIWGLISLKFKLKNPQWILPSFIFILLGLISLAFTPVKLNTMELLSSISYLIRFSLYILLGLLIYSDAFPNLKKNTYRLLFISAAALSVLGLTQLIFLPDLRFLANYGWDPHYFRTASTFLDPNFLGSFLVLALVLWYQKYRVAKKWYLYSGIIIYFALMTTFSRGAYLAFLTSFSLLSFLNKSFKLFILTIIFFSGLLSGFYTYQHIVAEPRGIDRVQSAEFRESTWQQGMQLFLKAPILGVGFNTYKFALKQYGLADESFLKSHGSTTNDSSFIYILSTTGIFGFIAYLFFLFSLFKFGWKEKILPAAVLGLITQSFFANTLFYPPLLIWIILAAAQKN